MGVRDEKENNLGDQIMLKVLQWQTRPGTEYNLEANYIEGLRIAKETRPDLIQKIRLE